MNTENIHIRIPATIPESAREVLSAFLSGLLSANDNFIDSVYITGSIPLDDFFPNKSDIDFLALCHHLPGETETKRLREIHHVIHKKYRATGLSGSYIAVSSFPCADYENIPALSYEKGHITYQKLPMAPVSLTELKTCSIKIYGRDPDLVPVSIDENILARFLHNNLNTYWARWTNQHSSFLKKGIWLTLFPRLTEWSVLGVARQLYTLHTGQITSKTRAGQFCLDILPAAHHEIIKEALTIRKDERTYPFVKTYAIRPSLKRSKATIRCIRYMTRLCDETYDKIGNYLQP